VAQSDHQRREFFRPAEVGWEPPIDVLEIEVELVVVVALPGVGALLGCAFDLSRVSSIATANMLL
jgi:hypothetical protein